MCALSGVTSGNGLVPLMIGSQQPSSMAGCWVLALQASTPQTAIASPYLIEGMGKMIPGEWTCRTYLGIPFAEISLAMPRYLRLQRSVSDQTNVIRFDNPKLARALTLEVTSAISLASKVACLSSPCWREFREIFRDMPIIRLKYSVAIARSIYIPVCCEGPCDRSSVICYPSFETSVAIVHPTCRVEKDPCVFSAQARSKKRSPLRQNAHNMAPPRGPRMPACEPCRQSKLSCDHGKPSCGRCLASSKANACFYRRRPFSRKTGSNHEDGSLSDIRTDRVEPPSP